MSEPVGSSGITVTGGDDAIRYDDLATYLRHGNWDEANTFLESNRDGVRRIITPDGYTALHIAISCGHEHIAYQLMQLMQEEDFLLRDIDGQTALHHAVQSDNVGHVLSETLMRMMSQEALGLQDALGRTPLHVAVSCGFVEIVEYLVPLMQVEDLGIQNADGLTTLHMASFYGQINMVEILVQAMKEQDLGKQENSGRTALCFAVVIGNIDMAKCMIEKNRNLLRNKFQERIPLVSASATQHIKMMNYLYTATPSKELQGIQAVMLLNTFILREMFDIALDLVKRYPLLATDPHLDLLQPLLVLAGMPSAFRSGSRHLRPPFLTVKYYSNSQIRSPIPRDPFSNLKGTFNLLLQDKMNEVALSLLRFICGEIQTQNSGDNETRKKLFHKPLMEATKNGIYEIVHEIINSDPSLFFETDTNSRRMIDLAILHRQENIFNLIYGLHETSWAFFISHRDGDQNTMLHLEGMPPSNQLTRISGAALQMQREIRWFKEVERILDPLDRNAKNKDKKTAHELFTENHVKLVKNGEKWMKAMTSSCTVVAALIVTIMFTAAFTVPGGNNQDSGAPIFLQKKLFLTFIICDAISFFTSSSSTNVPSNPHYALFGRVFPRLLTHDDDDWP